MSEPFQYTPPAHYFKDPMNVRWFYYGKEKYWVGWAPFNIEYAAIIENNVEKGLFEFEIPGEEGEDVCFHIDKIHHITGTLIITKDKGTKDEKKTTVYLCARIEPNLKGP